MRDLFGVPMSTGTIDKIYTDAAQRLAGFTTALVARLRGLSLVSKPGLNTIPKIRSAGPVSLVSGTGLVGSVISHMAQTAGSARHPTGKRNCADWYGAVRHPRTLSQVAVPRPVGLDRVQPDSSADCRARCAALMRPRM